MFTHFPSPPPCFSSPPLPAFSMKKTFGITWDLRLRGITFQITCEANWLSDGQIYVSILHLQHVFFLASGNANVLLLPSGNPAIRPSASVVCTHLRAAPCLTLYTSSFFLRVTMYNYNNNKSLVFADYNRLEMTYAPWI